MIGKTRLEAELSILCTNSNSVQESTIKDLSHRLHAAYVNMNRLDQCEKHYVIKIYLCYLLQSIRKKTDSISELQVLLYKLSDQFNFDEKNKTEPKISDRDNDIVQKRMRTECELSREKTNSQVFNSPLSVRKSIAKQLLSVGGKPLSNYLIDPDIEKKYLQNIELFLSDSDVAIQFSTQTIIDKLLKVIEGYSRPAAQRGWFNKCVAYVGLLLHYQKNENHRLIELYQKKGLFAYDCKRIYSRIMMKNMRGLKA